MEADDVEKIKFLKSLKYIDADGYPFDRCTKLNKIILPEGFSLKLKYEQGVQIEYY